MGLQTEMVPLLSVLLIASSSLAAPQFNGFQGDSSMANILQEQRFNMGDGKTITVKYTAGVDGFRIIEGDHIPSGGQTAARAITKDEDGKNVEYDYAYYDDTEPLSPFVNPFDP